jgi:hypothetical protein
MLLFMILWGAFFSSMAGGAGRSPFMVGKSRAKIYVEHQIKTRFADVAGVDEAKVELQEVIEFLRTPEKFRRLGGKVPKGVLLLGAARARRCWRKPWRVKRACQLSGGLRWQQQRLGEQALWDPHVRHDGPFVHRKLCG